MEEPNGVQYLVSGVVQGEVVPSVKAFSPQVERLRTSYSSN